MDATSLALGAKGKGKVVKQLERGLPLNMLPASFATHRAARRSPVHDDAVAAGSAVVLGPRARPASRDLGVLDLAQQGDRLRIALAQLDDRQLIAVAEWERVQVQAQMSAKSPLSYSFLRPSPDRIGGGSALESERVGFRLVLGRVSASA